MIVAEIPTSLLEDLAGQDATGYIFLADGLYPRIGSGLKEMIMERAEQLLTHEGRPAPTPEPIGVSVDATPEGYNNIRAFLIANNWDFSRCPLLPDFDMLAPISALPGVLHVTKLPARKYFEEIPSPPHVPGIDSPTSRNDGTPSSLGTGATAHGEQAWHDAGFDGTGVKIGIIDGSFLVITQPLPQGTCPTYRPRDACVVMPVQRTNATKSLFTIFLGLAP